MEVSGPIGVIVGLCNCCTPTFYFSVPFWEVGCSMPVMDALLSMAPEPDVLTNVPTQTSHIPENLAVSWVEIVPKIFQINIAKAKK